MRTLYFIVDDGRGSLLGMSGGAPAKEVSAEAMSCAARPPGYDLRLVEVFRILGKRWSGQIVGMLLLQPARFSELARGIPGLSDGVLNARLRELMAAGLIERQLAEGPTTAVLYSLTPAGEDFRTAFDELGNWAGRNGF